MKLRVTILSIVLALAALILAGCGRQAQDFSPSVEQTRLFREDMAQGRQFPQALAQNAAPIYTQLMQLLKAHPLTAQEKAALTLPPGASLPPAQWEQMARLVHDRADVMQLVHQAAARPQCAFVRDWAMPDPADIPFSELAAVRNAARFLEAESLLMARQGKPLDAVNNLTLGFQIARHGASDNTLIAYLVGVAIDAITLDGLKRILWMAGPNAAVAQSVKTTIAQNWKPRSLASALRTEVAFNLGLIAFLRMNGANGVDQITGDTSFSQAYPHLDPNYWNAQLNYSGVFILRQMEYAIQNADRPYPKAQPALGQIELQANDKRHVARFLAAVLLPDAAKTAEKRAQIQAMVDVDQAGAATLAQFARTGQLPDRLVHLPNDPFNGAPLKYRCEGTNGFVIYSVGQSGDFNGGNLAEYHWKPYQVAFRYPGPPEMLK